MDTPKIPTIPAGPWTVEKLGLEKYEELSRHFQCGVDRSFQPALDLTPQYEAQAANKAPRPSTQTEGSN